MHCVCEEKSWCQYFTYIICWILRFSSFPHRSSSTHCTQWFCLHASTGRRWKCCRPWQPPPGATVLLGRHVFATAQSQRSLLERCMSWQRQRSTAPLAFLSAWTWITPLNIYIELKTRQMLFSVALLLAPVLASSKDVGVFISEIIEGSSYNRVRIKHLCPPTLSPWYEARDLHCEQKG